MTIVYSQTFEGYANTAALLADWIESDPPGRGGNSTWTLDAVHTHTGTKAAKLALVGTVVDGDVYEITHLVTGLVPFAPYTFKRWLYPTGDFPTIVPDGMYSQLSDVLVANAAGEVTLRLRLTIVSGAGAVTFNWWYDDLTLEDQAEVQGDIDFTDIIVDSGVLFLNGVAYRPSRNSWTFDPQKVIEPWPYDGDYVAVAGTDQVGSMKPVLRGTLMSVSNDEMALYEAGGSDSTAGGVAIRTPPLVGVSLGVGALLSNVAVRWVLKDGGYLRVRFPYGLCTKYSIGSKDKDEGEIPVEIEARAATAASPLYYVDRY